MHSASIDEVKRVLFLRKVFENRHVALDLIPAMGRVDADRVEPNGALVNDTPTALLTGHLRGIAPLHLAAESFKLDDASQMGPRFERVPATLIEGFVTDRSVIAPSQIWSLVQSV